MNGWYYGEAGEQRGPISKEDLQTKFAAGTLDPGALVWCEGMTDWKPANSVAELNIPAPVPQTTVGRDDSAFSPYAPPTAAPLSGVDWSAHASGSYVPEGPQIRPWVRYWARIFDFLTFCVIFIIGAAIVAPELIEMNDTLSTVILIFAYAFYEPLLLTIFGATPFKALLKVRVRNKDGSKLSYVQGFRRTLSVWIAGQGLGIPIIALVTNIYSYSRLTGQGITSWDQSGNFTVSHQPVEWWRWLLLLGFVAGFIGLIILGSEA
ncbi:RDD family protein [Luteolibacter arcticus]|uniref:RDD family protein n=1 Tax=Luteolibacter arcticus TaxID=1581411 RepID=A0ABT3GKK4_9BACT|nr:RDD family protein [Luteolibacter arcticus]MCW1924020.1 RDD family protein [Luteolibacter arcticus]